MKGEGGNECKVQGNATRAMTLGWLARRGGRQSGRVVGRVERSRAKGRQVPMWRQGRDVGERSGKCELVKQGVLKKQGREKKKKKVVVTACVVYRHCDASPCLCGMCKRVLVRFTLQRVITTAFKKVCSIRLASFFPIPPPLLQPQL